MTRTTNRSQSAGAPNLVRTAKRTPGAGGSAPAPNAFLGKPERVPEIAFVRERPGDGFLGSAKTYYELFGIDVSPVDSIEQVVVQMANSMALWKRIVLVSHAHPRGMIIPFFTAGVKGTNKEIFREFAKSDLDGLKLLSPFPLAVRHLFNWNSILSGLMGLVRTANAAVLQPFGLHSSDNPEGDLLEYLKFAFDIVYLRNPKRVRRNAAQHAGLSAAQRTILEAFVREILNQMRPQVAASSGATAPQVDALRDVVLGLTYGQLSVGDLHPDLGLQDDSMNDFPTLKAVVTAIGNEFRKKLNAARTKVNAGTVFDIRGCRAGEDPDYLEAIREFLGAGSAKPRVTAPRHFQSYPEIAFQTPATRAHIGSWIGGAHWGLNSSEMKETFRKWAALIALDPLHVTFWRNLLRAPATAFESLAWRSQIPPLFLPTPGLAQLQALNLEQVIHKLKDYFNVPDAQVPSAAALGSASTRLPALTTFMTAAADSLETGDGLHYYMLYAGLPVFVHETPELPKNGLVMLGAHKVEALQSWYRCLWSDPLPSQGPYKTAKIETQKHRQVAALIGSDRTSLISICPIPKYSHCIRKRPLPPPPDDDESLC